MAKEFPFYNQLDQSDCGTASLRMVAKHYGKSLPTEYLREKSFINKDGVSIFGISEAAQAIGFRTLSVQIPFSKLKLAPLPCIVHWRQRHFVVVYGVEKGKVSVADPAFGKLTLTTREFLGGWHGEPNNPDKTGVVLLLEPTADFYQKEPVIDNQPVGFGFLTSYLRPYQRFLFQLFLGLLLGSFLQLLFPFLMQALVDRGVEYRDFNFVYLILAAQLMLFLSATVVGFIRSWILLHVSSRINIALISDFLAKLMRLPISFFDTRVTGDILQRIDDHRRVKNFLTTSTLNILFSLVNFAVFGAVLAVFNLKILAVFCIGTGLYFGWVWLFLKRRRQLDFKQFDQLSENQSHLVQLVEGMQDIKLNNCEDEKRWGWERIQARLFQTNVEGLRLSQAQQTGAFFITQFKDILISFASAKAVIDGQMTLGSMLAVQYMVGQLSAPLAQMIGFIESAQDAKMSLQRLADVHGKADEDPPELSKLTVLPPDRSLYLREVSFGYLGPNSPQVLHNLDLVIPQGKVTAIVGASGSGKTTLLKLLLKFYPPVKGQILVGNQSLEAFHSGWWRRQCGAVIQDGFIYSDSILKNIVLGTEQVDEQRLEEALRIANLDEFLEKLPMGLKTKIGTEGMGLSEGQKQRILIARAVYKDPQYLFFDEATNALDANNEQVIMNNLTRFFKGKTVVVVAHRLSTVKNADQIVVLHNGSIIEQGSHQQLAFRKGHYYELVKNQLELGN